MCVWGGGGGGGESSLWWLDFLYMSITFNELCECVKPMKLINIHFFKKQNVQKKALKQVSNIL